MTAATKAANTTEVTTIQIIAIINDPPMAIPPERTTVETVLINMATRAIISCLRRSVFAVIIMTTGIPKPLAKVWIEPPIYFCYGTNIEIGEGCYINFNCNFVDDTKIIIGKRLCLIHL